MALMLTLKEVFFFGCGNRSMVEITVMQHKGVNGNVHSVTRLHVTFRYQGPLLLYFTREGSFWCSLAVCRHGSDAKLYECIVQVCTLLSYMATLSLIFQLPFSSTFLRPSSIRRSV